MSRSVSIRVTGKVQGVFFRATAQSKAQQLGLTGFVRNERDGSVYLEAEGPEEKVRELIAWCKAGPPQSTVDHVEVEELAGKGFKGFEIKRA